jgi:hypothetical protein
MPIERPDFGDGESRNVVPAAQPVDLDALPAGSVISGETLLASVEAEKPATTGNGISAELRKTWEREGGFDLHLKAAQERANHVLGAADDANALRSHFDTLPASIQSKVFDVLRLSPSRSPNAGLRLINQIESTLTPQELTIAEAWLSKCTPAQKSAIIRGMGSR